MLTKKDLPREKRSIGQMPLAVAAEGVPRWLGLGALVLSSVASAMIIWNFVSSRRRR